jgi:ribosome-binding factor A
MLGDAGKVAAATIGLNNAAGFLRHELGRRMTMRGIPQLHFVHDQSVERGMQLSQLIDEAVGTSGRSKKKRD